MSGVAASTYNNLVKNADPIGAIAAGMQLRQQAQRIDLAQDAQRQNQLFQFIQLGNDRMINQQKMKLAEESQKIDAFNAITNRMNAERAARTLGTSSGGSGINILSMLKSDENGLYLDPSILSAGPAGTGTPEVQQGPTDGEGDGTEVLPLRPGPATPRVLGDSSAGALPLPEGEGATTNPFLPSPSGAPAPTAPNSMPSTSPAPTNRLRLNRVSINAKGQPTLSFEQPDAPKAAGPTVTPQFLDALNKQYAHLGVQAVPDVTTEGKLSYNFVPKADLKGGDFSIASLPADVQTKFIEDVNGMIADAAEIESPSDIEKMRAAGLDIPDGATPEQIAKAAAQMQSEGRDWRAAYEKVKKDKENALLDKASVYAKKLNAQFAGKTGYVPRSGIDVLRDIGLTSVQARPAPQATPMAPNATMTTAPAPVQATTPGSPRLGAAPSAQDSEARLARMQAEVDAETDPAQKRLKQGFLDASRARLAAQQGPTSEAAPTSRAGANEDPWAMPARSEAPKSQADPRREASVQQWENSKASVVRAMKSTLTQAEIDRFGAADMADPATGNPGTNTDQRINDWLQKNGDKLGITPKDGGKLTAKSVVFVDHEGRSITMREIVRATMADPRFKQARTSEMTTSSGKQVKVSIGKAKQVE